MKEPISSSVLLLIIVTYVLAVSTDEQEFPIMKFIDCNTIGLELYDRYVFENTDMYMKWFDS